MWKKICPGTGVPEDALEIGLILDNKNPSGPPLRVYAGRAVIDGKYFLGKFYDPKLSEWTLYATVNGSDVAIKSDFEVRGSFVANLNF